MHKLSLLLLAGAAAASELEAIARKVNAANAGWTAAVPTKFNSTAEVANLCGTYLRGHPHFKGDSIPKSTLEVAADLPASFDAREAFPQCSVIGHVRDQSSCGSCWAFGSTEAFEGRRCVATGDNIMYSAEDTNACCDFASGCFSFGCGGGQPGLALQWMARTGVVTGGDFGDKVSCKPYSFPPCAHHVAPGKYPACPSDYATPKCAKQCQGAYETAYADDKRNGGSVTTLSSVNQIKTALQKGPVSTAFTVYEDFVTYKSGVYKHTHGSALGGHAVLIVGYGTEAGTDFWLVKNSWNEEWGDNGFFKIAHGQCGIDDGPNAIDF